MDRFYGMGEDGNALCGMDDCGEMSSWYVFNAMGFYTYSPADPEYLVTVPLFDEVKLQWNDHQTFIIQKKTPAGRSPASPATAASWTAISSRISN